MRKLSSYARRLGMFLAMASVLTFIIGCPTDTEEEKPKPLSAGFYVGGAATDVSAETGDDIVTKAFNWLRTNAVEEGVYTIVLGADINATLAVENDGQHNDGSDGSAAKPGWIFLNTVTVNNVHHLTVTIKSDATQRTIQLANKGTLLDMGEVYPADDPNPFKSLKEYAKPGVELKVILENIVLKGHDENNAQLVCVGAGATLEIRNGAKITGNTVNYTDEGGGRGAGVLVLRDGLVTLDGGSIDHNIAKWSGDPSVEAEIWGGGVCVSDNGNATFIMKSGSIEYNQVISPHWTLGSAIGLMSGKVSIEGGTITRNTANSTSETIGDAALGVFGVNYMYNGPFSITGGTISNNSAFAAAGKVNFPGVGVRDSNSSYTVRVGGNPVISDGIALRTATSTILVDHTKPLTNTAAIPIDIVDVAGALAPNRQIIQWDNTGNADALPVAKFTLGKLRKEDGTAEDIPGSIGADGRYVVAFAGEGLYKDNDTTAIDVSAQAGGDIITKSINYLATNAEANGVYTIIVGSDITATLPEQNTGTIDNGSSGYAEKDPWLLIDDTRVNGKSVTINIEGLNGVKTIQLGNKGALLQVGLTNSKPDSRTVKVNLKNIVLKGLSVAEGDTVNNNAQVVYVSGGGVLTLLTGSKITSNTHQESKEIRGGGALVRQNGKLIVDGGIIDKCVADCQNDGKDAFGGAVCVVDSADAVFQLKSGKVTQNKAISTQGTARGAVFVSSGKLIMEGGEITSNTAQSSGSNALGGGISAYVSPSEFTIRGGKLSGNAGVSSKLGYNGARVNTAITLDGNPEITDPLLLSDAASVVVSIGNNFNPVKPVVIDFTAADADTLTTGGAWKDRVHFKWASSGKTDPLPVANIKLNQWVMTADPFTKQNIAGSIDPATGAYTQQ